MNNVVDFLKKKSEVDQSFLLRKKKEKEVWQGFPEEARALENTVSYEFGEVLRHIGPMPVDEHVLGYMPDAISPRILGWEVEYHPVFHGHDYQSVFSIEITRAILQNGEKMDNDLPGSSMNCPHTSLAYVCGWGDEVHPEIKEFKERFGVTYVSYPKNNCSHK